MRAADYTGPPRRDSGCGTRDADSYGALLHEEEKHRTIRLDFDETVSPFAAECANVFLGRRIGGREPRDRARCAASKSLLQSQDGKRTEETAGFHLDNRSFRIHRVPQNSFSTSR